jgi:hypothetical protein
MCPRSLLLQQLDVQPRVEVDNRWPQTIGHVPGGEAVHRDGM